MSVAQLLERKEICICAGAGGVGKTTTSAAIATGMAARGKKVAVLTIDPAKRLANSLGMSELGNEERLVDREMLRASGIEMKGELWAMMLDAKRTFDEIVERHAPDPQTRDAVLGNHIYQEISSALAGSQEYMAMEKLLELHDEGRYDLLVLDTPPTRSALDFLDAPERLARFVDSRSLQFFTAPGRFGLLLVGRGTGVLGSVVKRVTGIDVLEDISEFFRSFGGMTEGFRERAAQVDALLADRRTTFLLVTSPRDHAIEDAMFFRDRLLEDGLPFGGVIANRVEELEPRGSDRVQDEMAALLDKPLARKIVHTLDDYSRLAEQEHESLERLADSFGGRPMCTVPNLDDGVSDARGLALMNEHLFGGERAQPVPT